MVLSWRRELLSDKKGDEGREKECSGQLTERKASDFLLPITLIYLTTVLGLTYGQGLTFPRECML